MTVLKSTLVKFLPESVAQLFKSLTIMTRCCKMTCSEVCFHSSAGIEVSKPKIGSVGNQNVEVGYAFSSSFYENFSFGRWVLPGQSGASVDETVSVSQLAPYSLYSALLLTRNLFILTRDPRVPLGMNRVPFGMYSLLLCKMSQQSWERKYLLKMLMT